MVRALASLIVLIGLCTVGVHQSSAAPEGAHQIRLTGHLTKPSRHSPQWICYEFLEKKKRVYGIQDPRQELKVVRIVKTPQSGTRIILQQLLFDTPVWGGSLQVELDTHGVIGSVEGTYYPDLEKKLFHLPMHAAVSADKAISIAKSSLETGVPIVSWSRAYLYYLPARPGCPLVYAVSFELDTPRHDTRTVFVHSLTKRVIK